MRFKFHHLNLCTDNLPRLTKFYQRLFDLGTIRDEEHTWVNAGKPRDIAGACLFLASDLSAYITGATIDVNGGSHIH